MLGQGPSSAESDLVPAATWQEAANGGATSTVDRAYKHISATLDSLHVACLCVLADLGYSRRRLHEAGRCCEWVRALEPGVSLW